MLYGFPPGVGATGTAALLNVPQSLEQLLAALQVSRTHVTGAILKDGCCAVVGAYNCSPHHGMLFNTG